MSKINIKTDFKNGEKLLDTQLNNNFKQTTQKSKI